MQFSLLPLIALAATATASNRCPFYIGSGASGGSTINYDPSTVPSETTLTAHGAAAGLVSFVGLTQKCGSSGQIFSNSTTDPNGVSQLYLAANGQLMVDLYSNIVGKGLRFDAWHIEQLAGGSYRLAYETYEEDAWFVCNDVPLEDPKLFWKTQPEGWTCGTPLDMVVGYA